MAKYASQKITNSELKTYDNKWGHLFWQGEESKKPIKDLMGFLMNKKPYIKVKEIIAACGIL
ncbi:hypothetical protein ADICYQ_2334 [Cyclobacterium qasimii M12-11B]|nr:hypothetical protein ADICYQ_2334 [Cyclobacterium qasimii M12-11B]